MRGSAVARIPGPDVLTVAIRLLKPLSLKLECCSGLSFVSDRFPADREPWHSGTNHED
jgi:hypothetical protein